MTRGLHVVEIPFAKFEGCGNDYVYVDLCAMPLALAELMDSDASRLAVEVSDRHFGVGSDGLVLIGSSDRADARMHMFNADGSRGAMCGNALRCIAKYLGDGRLRDQAAVALETDVGVRQARLTRRHGEVVEVDVDMGAPSFGLETVPCQPGSALRVAPGDERPAEVEIQLYGAPTRGLVLSMGNPHLVVFVDDVDLMHLSDVGPPLETARMFPDRVNVEFVEVRGDSLRQRTWERGAGETLGCGSGACAVAVAAVALGYVGRGTRTRVELRGGDLGIAWAKTGAVHMRGTCRLVFTGTYRYGSPAGDSRRGIRENDPSA